MHKKTLSVTSNSRSLDSRERQASRICPRMCRRRLRWRCRPHTDVAFWVKRTESYAPVLACPSRGTSPSRRDDRGHKNLKPPRHRRLLTGSYGVRVEVRRPAMEAVTAVRPLSAERHAHAQSIASQHY
ncbi:hypothetical protein E2C01_005667 [Portunus trituberculatus]|uniref:Uncharacterized protein n=1 Tax=Portunus trituberculatus TaxID=210409 RepID=A0A5B7CU23_PORTR|nr:hypothetical protein [Portunus trituberculatus]